MTLYEVPTYNSKTTDEETDQTHRELAVKAETQLKPTKRKPVLMLEDGAAAADGQAVGSGSRPEKKPKVVKESILTTVQTDRLTKLAHAATELMEAATVTVETMGQYDVPLVYSRHYTTKRVELAAALATINLALASSKGKASDLTAELKGAIEACHEAETKIGTFIDNMIDMGVQPRDGTHE